MAYEKASPIRHEYVDGQLFAMAGESKNHNRVGSNILVKLLQGLESSKCEAFFEGIKVKVGPTRYYYPDVVVTSTEPEEDEDAYIIENPVMIVEVLSSSTARNDRVEKMNAYQRLPGLREYVIVSQETVRVEVYRHDRADDVW